MNLLTEGHNLDKSILNGSLFQRQDHKFNDILNLIKPNDVIYDIGAYIGTFSIPLALENMKVYAFEGFPDNFERLSLNCKPYNNITTHLVAVSNENKTVKTKFNDCTAGTPIKREINYAVFDDYIKQNKIEKPNLIKLDIEGMETLALYGMIDLIENVRPIWQIGYHKGLKVKYADYPGFVEPENGGFDFNRFKELGYSIYDEQGRLVEGFTVWGEYLCVPN
tara:strand:- start:299 stop:964 length:666 start_codon:yes stop_codon:yes gene_type:complete